MHLTSKQVNYWIWRYLQEEGLELAAHAFDHEATVDDAEFSPSYVRGELVTLLLKGLQMRELEVTAAEEALAQRKHSPAVETKAEPVILSNGASHSASLDLVPAQHLPGASVASFADESRGILGLGTEYDATLLKSDGSETKLRYAPLDAQDANITALAWQPGSQAVALGSYSGALRIWTTEGALSKNLVYHKAPLMTLKWNNDGTLLAAVDCVGSVSLWNASQGKQMLEWPPTQEFTEFEWLDSTVYASTHSVMVPVGSLGTFKLDADGSNMRYKGPRTGHTKRITSLTADSGTKLLASGSEDCTVQLWGAQAQTPLRTISNNSAPITILKWVPGSIEAELDSSKIASRLLVGSADGSVKLWALESPPNCLWTIDLGAAVTLAVFNETHSRIALAADTLVLFNVEGSPPARVGEYPATGIMDLAWQGTSLVCATHKFTEVFEDL